MKITNEDKIQLLEFIGYEINELTGIARLKDDLESGIYLMNIDPLDISILSKALDIIEKDCYVFIESIITTKKCSIQNANTGNMIAHSMCKTREEAIFKACIEYFKQQKS